MLNSRLARRFPLAAFARQNLSRARARTALAMVGITIGVVAVASLGMFGVAFEQYFLNTVDDTTRTVFVTPGEDAVTDSFDQEHVARIRQYTDDPLLLKSSRQATVGGLKRTTETRVIRMNDPGGYISAGRGRIPSGWRSGALVGAELASTLGVTVGDSVTVDGETHRVVAVLASSDRRTGLLQTDRAVVLPPPAGGLRQVDEVLVRTESPQAAFATADRLREKLNGREERYAIEDAESAIQSFRDQMSTINTFLLAVGGVSLLVAAVSILNVMLMSAIERREEIGVLRAVGYRRADVLRLMLYEAALLGVAGATAGVFLSVVLGMVINAEFLADPLAFTLEALGYVVIGFVFGTATSFLSGLYPAWKAANARPVEALRD